MKETEELLIKYLAIPKRKEKRREEKSYVTHEDSRKNGLVYYNRRVENSARREELLEYAPREGGVGMILFL